MEFPWACCPTKGHEIARCWQAKAPDPRWHDVPLDLKIFAACDDLYYYPPVSLRLATIVGRTPWSAADALVGPALVAAMLLCGAGAFACQSASSTESVPFKSIVKLAPPSAD